ncbi:MAG: hypothetical protein D4R84_02055 [Rhodocyclaceae bacterium]|nr:MAG: hypothetical protein D4R84_02055 [Rhodocyclaceae bacterium]
MLADIVFGVIAMTVAIVFYAIPVVKLAPTLGLRVIPLVVVVLIGVVMMIVEFIQTVRASRDN